MKELTHLYKALQQQGFSFITFQEYVEDNYPARIIILRHDVEQKYDIAFEFAQIQNSLGIKGTYFFRILPKCFKPEIVKEIAKLGHETGYHYDDLTYSKGDYKKAIVRFQKNLEILREIAPVKTICMDGSPLSKHDNKDLWRTRELKTGREGDLVNGRKGEIEKGGKNGFLFPAKHYRDFGIIGDPYFDINFDEVFYLTDIGRKWDGWTTSVRDKVPQQGKWIKQGLVFHSTADIINAADQDRLPDKIMFTFHPQRWNDKSWPWVKELVWQNVKNVGKRVILKVR